ncbi:hypothetical protein D3C83_55740 [compost metagenome]
MHRGPRWLIDYQKNLVLVEDISLETECRRMLRRRRGFRSAHRRQAQAVAGLNPVIGTDAAAVDAHFTAAQDAIDMTFRDPFQPFGQVVVHTLASRFRLHFMPGR